MGILLSFAFVAPAAAAGIAPTPGGAPALIEDARDDSVDGCYTRQEYRAALEEAKLIDVLYGVLVETIQNGSISNVRAAGQPTCTEAPAPSAGISVSPNRGAVALFVALALVIAILSCATGIIVSRGQGRRRS